LIRPRPDQIFEITVRPNGQTGYRRLIVQVEDPGGVAGRVNVPVQRPAVRLQ
jgi:hypothetical protein